MTTTPSDNTSVFDGLLGYQSSHSIDSPVATNISRYPPSDVSPRPSSSPPGYSFRSPFSPSAEDLNTQYSSNSATLARPHSMSSLSAPPVMNQHAAMQYHIRRASAPTGNVMFYDQPPPRQLSLGEYETWMVNSVTQESFDSSIDLAMPTEPQEAKSEHSQSWWDGGGKMGILDASQEISQRLSVQSQTGDGISSSTLRRYSNSNARHSPYGSLVYLHQPPSPTFDDEDSAIYPHCMASPTPSPPESPDFFFPSAMPTPEIEFPAVPPLSRSSLPPVTAITAASAALAASKPPKPRSRQSSSSRPGSSRRKASSGSMRSQARLCGSPASGLQGSEIEMAFVNYTPQDATRILNGVAPSGSSKTKARREREAAEKRRRIAAVATAAVEAAGGDPSILASVV